jgi:hypothetical protein
MNLEHDVSRASTLARLDRIIDQLRNEVKLDSWSADERDWLAALLNPFGRTSAQCRRISSDRTAPSPGLLLSSVIEDLMTNGLSSVELLAIVRLYGLLQKSKPTFAQDDERRVLRLAESMRRYLIDEPVRVGLREPLEVA